MELSDRKLKILSAVVDSYVQNGEPVSSKTLCNLLDFSVSSATIRNELAELTELGLLEQPHTSAGRIPSNLGYRLYINKLMGKVSLSKKNKRIIDSSLNSNIKNPDQLLKEAAHLLVDMTSFAVISTNISAQTNYIKSIQLVKISNYNAMIILTTSSGIIKNQLFRCDFLLSYELLDSFTKILNENFSGILVDDITPALIQTVAASLGELALLMSDVFTALFDVCRQASKMDIHFDGQANLFMMPEFNQQSAVNVIKFFSCPDDISRLFLASDGKNTKVFIGDENQYEALSQSSIIITRYHVDSQGYGSIGVIGPTRMNYAKLIASLEYMASSIGEILNNLLNLE